MPKADSFLTITPYSPNKKYYPVKLGIAGDHTFNQVNGSGGWQIVERPKQTAATQWFDRSPFQLVIPCIIDPSVTKSHSTADHDYEQIKSWLSAPSLSSAVIQPPTMRLSGPILGTDMTWVVFSVEWKEAIRDHVTGALLQQMLTMTFYEYNAPFPSSGKHKSPARTAQSNDKESSVTRKYIVREGDTLAKIASQQMKEIKLSYAEAAIIAANKSDKSLNMRSANQVLHSLQGKTIKIPVV